MQMLSHLLGSMNKERVLVYLAARRRGYAREIARFFDVPLAPIQKALDGLEFAAVLVSRTVGRTREYEFNPRYLLRDELAAMLEKALRFYLEERRNALLVFRSRPRRKGKPLYAFLENCSYHRHC